MIYPDFFWGVGGAEVRQKDDFVTKLISQFISCKYMFCEIFFSSFCATLKIWLSNILRIKKIKGVFFAIIKIKSCAKPLENLLTSPRSVKITKHTNCSFRFYKFQKYPYNNLKIKLLENPAVRATSPRSVEIIKNT